MLYSLTCPQGHAWDADVEDAACPVCGSAAESLDEGDSSTWDSGIPDELPPPPGASARPLVRESPDVVPAIPGYEIASELGRGGMGVVFAARHRALNRQVALKVIRGFAGRDEVARFRAEAEAVARLQHPNIVQIYEVGEHVGLPYLALEFVDGGSLSAQIRREPLAPRAAADLVATLARAVQHAHLRGVVHRDLKPANVLLAGDGVAKIADFGLAKLADDPGRSRSGQIVGTPSYMAPEQAAGRGDLVGPPADVWALGAILYECMTMRPPFLGASSIETVQQVLDTEPVAPARQRPGIPRDLETICLKCLRKEPEARYRTAGDLADDLDRFLEGKPIRARRTPWWERAAMWARRRPAAAALLLVIALAAASLAGLGYRNYRATEQYNRDLEANNATITRNNIDLEQRNTTITQQARDLETEKATTTLERDRAEDNLLGAVEAVDGLLGATGADQLAHVPHLDQARAVLLEKALKVCDRLLVLQAGNPRLGMLRAASLQRAGRILTLLQRFPEANERLDQAIATIKDLRAQPGKFSPADITKIEALARTSRGSLLVAMGKPDRAAEEQDAVLELLREYLTANPTDREFRFLAAIVNANRGIAALDGGDSPRALLHLTRSRQLAEDLTREDNTNGGYLSVLALVLNALGVVNLDLDSVEEAGELFQKAIEIGRRLVTVFPGDVDFREALARSLSNYGNILRRRGYLMRAAEPLAEGLAIREALARDHPEIAFFVVELCWSYYHIGRLHDSRDDFRTAIDWFTKGLDRLTKDPSLLKKNAHARTLAASVYRYRGSARARLNQNRAAADDLEAALKFVAADLRPVLQADIGLLRIAHGDSEKALAAIESALAAPTVSPEVHFNAARVFAQTAKAAPKGDRADELARRAVAELVAAEKAGYFRDPKHLALLESSTDLKYLQTREDFNEIRDKVRKQ